MDSVNWVSINLGVFICIVCSGIHRSLGTHLSRVRSLHLDHLTDAQLGILKRLGNARAAEIWESKATSEDKRGGVAAFVKEKYINKTFLADKSEVENDTFQDALNSDDLVRVAWFVARSKPPFYIAQKMTALHVAAMAPNSSPELCEFLLQNGADLGIHDELGRTPSDVAREMESFNAEGILRCWAASVSASKSRTADLTEDV